MYIMHPTESSAGTGYIYKPQWAQTGCEKELTDMSSWQNDASLSGIQTVCYGVLDYQASPGNI